MAELLDDDKGRTPADQGAQLTSGDCCGHQVAGSADSVNVRVQAALAPAAFKFEAALLEREHQEMDGCVELVSEAHRIHSKAGERVVLLRFENPLEVVHHFPAPPAHTRPPRPP